MKLSPRSLMAAFLLGALTAGRAPAAAPQVGENPPLKADETAAAARTAWWRDAKFGLFIHWGLYSLPAGSWKNRPYSGIGEWIMYKAHIPLADYEALAREFNPTAFDPDAWAQLAQDAGMKYLVLTAKHHDGFAMFDSAADPFNIVAATPFKRDVVKELAAACAKRGLKFGVYYSQAQDWHHPGGGIWKGPHEEDPVWENPVWDPKQVGDFDHYLDTKAIPQVRELLTNYGPLGLIWFDTPLNLMSVERAKRVEAAVRELQPQCLVSGRIGGNSQSDYHSEGDNQIPNLARTGLWETPATLNDTWGFKTDDHNWKKPEDLVFKLVDIVSKGGNYLLNIGPDGHGVIPQPSLDMLHAVGRWTKVNGEAIYGAGRSPFGQEFGAVSPTRKDAKGRPLFEPLKAWRCTTRPGKLYIHLLEWPAGGSFELPAVSGRILRASLLAQPETALTCVQRDTGVSLTLPNKSPDPIVSVVRLELEQAP